MSKIYSYFYLPNKKTFLHCFAPTRAYLLYKDFRIDLLTGQKDDYSIDRYFERLDSLSIDQYFQQPVVMHLFYELGYKFIGRSDLIPPEAPLMISIEYGGHHFVPQEFFKREAQKINLSVKEYPHKSQYLKKFDECFENLLKGNCYQLNLTDQFCFDFPAHVHPMHFLFKLWGEQNKISPYAHCSYVDSLHKLFVSNSPECLFQIRHGKNKAEVSSMPIKGTLSLAPVQDIKEAEKKLAASAKDESELYMISDLVRNDLSSIHQPTAKIVRKKASLAVPGLLHQYSHLKVDIPYQTSLLQVIAALFPGGSITGAPKKKVMELLKGIETGWRGFYCGSTVILHKSLKAASINIRSAEVDFEWQEMLYGAGGGITLQSQGNDEFNEMYSKMKSFVDILQ